MSADVFAPLRELAETFTRASQCYPDCTQTPTRKVCHTKADLIDACTPETALLLSRLLREHAERGEDAAKWQAHVARKFPIMDGPDIPWTAIEPFEKVAQRNHSQSLERLAQRGGLSVVEAIAVMLDIRIFAPAWHALLAKPLPENIARLRSLSSSPHPTDNQ